MLSPQLTVVFFFFLKVKTDQSYWLFTSLEQQTILCLRTGLHCYLCANCQKCKLNINVPALPMCVWCLEGWAKQKNIFVAAVVAPGQVLTWDHWPACSLL